MRISSAAANWPEAENPLRRTADCQDNSWSRFAGDCVSPDSSTTSRPRSLEPTRDFLASLVAPLPNSEQTKLPSSNHTYTKSTPKHIHHHYAASVTSTHTTHIIFNCTHIRTIFSPLDLWTDPAGMTALLARWTGKLAVGPQAGTSDSPPLARVMGVGSQQQPYGRSILKYECGYGFICGEYVDCFACFGCGQVYVSVVSELGVKCES